jgi:hypothetical protein
MRREVTLSCPGANMTAHGRVGVMIVASPPAVPARPGEKRWEGERGEARFWIAAPTVVLITLAGHVSADLAPAVSQAFRQSVLAASAVHGFADFFGLESYDPEVRRGLTQVVADLRPRIAALDVVLRNRMVAMGVSVVNLALGGLLTVHRSQVRFDQLLNEAIARAPRGR